VGSEALIRAPEARTGIGGALLHPIPLVAIAVLLLNDHYLKHAHPGWVTGKLSDFSGLVFFPLFLIAAYEASVPGSRPASKRAAQLSVLATGLVFAWINTSVLGAETYRAGLGLLQWPFFAAVDLARGEAISGLHRVAFARDPSDLVALPALALPLWLERRRARALTGRTFG